jgi:hypothetical protein
MSTLLLDTTFLSADDFDFQAHGRGNEMCDRTQADHSTKKLAAIFSDDRQAVSAFRTNSLGTFIHELFMCCTLQRMEPFGCCGGKKGERPWLRRSAQPSWLHLWLSLLFPLHRLQRPKKASPTNKASPYNADPTRRTSCSRHAVRAPISRAAAGDFTKDQKQKNMVAIRQRIAEMR